MSSPIPPAEVRLETLCEALEYCEQNYVECDGAPDGRWYMKVWSQAEEIEHEAWGTGFVAAYRELRSKAGSSPFGGAH